MRKVLEIHILQNFAPSNLNRDDTGSPKDAVFGGVRRARISSQCLKRAARSYFRANSLIGGEHLAVRTKRVTDAIAEALVARKRPEDDAKRIAETALGALELQIKDDKSQYLLFLGAREIDRMATLIDKYWDALSKVARGDEDKTKRAKDAKKLAKGALPAELTKAMAEAIDGGKAVDIALFGRMLADLPEKNTDAAAQVAHAISTHRVDREFDFYTAVDDRRPDDTQGADMLGTVEFNSACYYRYAAIDLDKLMENLQRDSDLALQGVTAFLRAAIFAEPTGKQNTFAAHNPPGFIAFTVRENASPRSLANAFERPVRPGEHGLTVASVRALAKEWTKLDGIFGQSGTTNYVSVVDPDGEVPPGDRAPTVDALIEATMRTTKALLEA